MRIISKFIALLMPAGLLASKMALRMVLAILLVALPLSYGEAKPKKIVKGITFDGEVVKGTPQGYGTLVIARGEGMSPMLEIKGNFDNDKICNARLEYFYNLRYDDGKPNAAAILINILEGDFTYSFTKKWWEITFEASSVNLFGVKNVNLGKFVIRRDDHYNKANLYRYETGQVFLDIPKEKYNDLLKLVGHLSEKYLTNYDYTLGYEWDPLLTLGRNYRSPQEEYTDVLLFSDKSELICNVHSSPTGCDEYVFCSAEGDTIHFEDKRYSKFPYQIEKFRIIDSEKNVYNCDDCTYHNLRMNILYADGSKYEGRVVGDFLEEYQDGLEAYLKMKAFTKSSIKYHTGTYTDASRVATEYIDGDAKEEYEKRLQAEEEAKRMQEEERQRQMQLKIEQEKREAEQYNRTHPLKHRRCTNCQGTGRCPTCNGRGWFIHPMNNERMQCGYCLYKGICPTCRGDGIEDYR